MLKPHSILINFSAQSEIWQEFGRWRGRCGFSQANESDRAWQAENVTKFGEHKYRGHPVPPQNTPPSEQDWLRDLREAYNKPDGKTPEGKQRNDRVPGYNGVVNFIDVVSVALSAFRYRAFGKGACK